MAETPSLNDLYGTIKDKELAILQELKLLVDAFNAELADLVSETTAGTTPAAQYFARVKSTVSYVLGQDLTNVLAQYAPTPTTTTVPPVTP